MNNLTHEFPEFCIDLAKSAPTILTIQTFYQDFCNIQLVYTAPRKDITHRSPARNQPEEILLKTLLKQESIASSAIPPELFAASNAFIQDLDFYDHNRALHRHVLRQRERHAPRRDRYRSGQIATAVTSKNENATIGRTKAENPRFSAQKKGNIQRHETLTDRSLQAFLPALSVRTWDDIAHRYNLEKPLHKAARSTPSRTDYQARSFWQWIEPPPDLPICIPQCAASLQEGGAAL